MYFFFLILLVFISNPSLAFDYEIETHAKRKIIKSYPISENKRYISFILEGTWTDNLGNYGLIEQSSTLILQNEKVIRLDGYGKTIYQNNEETYYKGYRAQQEKDSGVGETIIINASEKMKELIGLKCKYAVKFFSDIAYALAKCKISEEQKMKLISLSR